MICVLVTGVQTCALPICYGRIEARAKLPSGRGTWPAIWMLPTGQAHGGWPASGEIDIMEHVGYDPGRVHVSGHHQAYHHVIGTQKTSITMVPGAMSAFRSAGPRVGQECVSTCRSRGLQFL